MDQSSPSNDAPTPNQSDTDQVSSAFELLHAGVQRQLWRMGWTELRPLQVNSIKAILQSDKDVILSASTASGKTEAAFLPILSRIAQEPYGSVRAMYVGPLKALIDDQFNRVKDLCTHLEVPIYHWHGDVSASEKTRMIKQPGGVLLITPESLESLFVNRSQHLSMIFGGLQFVVIDELHSFLNNERGLHLRSLLHRIRRLKEELPEVKPFRTIALSATIGDYLVGQKYIDCKNPDEVAVLRDSNEKDIKYRIHGYSFPALSEIQKQTKEKGLKSSTVDTQSDEINDPLLPYYRIMAKDIVHHCAGYSNLVFANSKADVEIFSDLAKQLAQEEHLADPFLVHHGSLSAYIRKDTEYTMKSDRAATAFCTSTLEMGIDIGSVKMIGQIGPSWSVSSQVQRMGRSGRKDGDPRIMRVYIECHKPEPKDDIFHRLHLSLVQGIAITELMLGKWLEPPQPSRCDISTLTQQIISVIAETGGIQPKLLYNRLCQSGAFRDIEPDLFSLLLHRLGGLDVIEQMGNGDLILGLKGEQLRKDRGFYACFATEEEYSVLHESQVLGTIQIIPHKHEHLLFAGRRWLVLDVDENDHVIHVQPAKGWKRPIFTGGPGEVHLKIRQKMRDVLSGNSTYSYLDNEAADLLAYARKAALKAGVCTQSILELSPHQSALMTWTGSRIQDTLAAMFRAQGLNCFDKGIALTFNIPREELQKAIQAVRSKTHNPQELARDVFPRHRRKYDWLFSEELLDICISRDVLDCEGAIGTLQTLSGEITSEFSISKEKNVSSHPFKQQYTVDSNLHCNDTSYSYAKPRNPIHIITGQDSFENLCQQLAEEPILALDVETTIWDKPRLLCTIQLATAQMTWIIDVLTLKDLRAIAPILESPNIVKIIHYAKFECSVFSERGITIKNIYDTCEVSGALRPDQRHHSLDVVVLRELNRKMDKGYQKADWKRRPLPREMIQYAALDAEILFDLRNIFLMTQ